MRFLILLVSLIFILPASADDLKDVKPPVDLPVNNFWLYSCLAAAAIAAGFLIWKYLIKGKMFRTTSVPRSPWTVALERLEELRKQDLPRKGLAKEYYTQLSDVMRRYVEDRFHIRAPEMTTQEFLWSLKTSESLTEEQKKLLSGFLNSCDLVKFAKYGPAPQEMDESFDSARRLIEETKVAPAPAGESVK